MTVHSLPEMLDTCAADSLRATLLGLVERREPLLLDGASVSLVGQACLQVLLSARSTAAAEGLPYALAAPSAPLSAMIALARIDAVLDPIG